MVPPVRRHATSTSLRSAPSPCFEETLTPFRTPPECPPGLRADVAIPRLLARRGAARRPVQGGPRWLRAILRAEIVSSGSTRQADRRFRQAQSQRSMSMFRHGLKATTLYVADRSRVEPEPARALGRCARSEFVQRRQTPWPRSIDVRFQRFKFLQGKWRERVETINVTQSRSEAGADRAQAGGRRVSLVVRATRGTTRRRSTLHFATAPAQADQPVFLGRRQSD